MSRIVPSIVAAAIAGFASASAAAQTSGDFNGDGYADLVIAVPYETVNLHEQAGAVHVIYGSAGRLATAPAGAPAAQFWHQDSTGVLDDCEPYDHFGAAIAVGDFNNDGYDDLAIGVPGEDVNGVVDAGAVVILYGTKNGLRPKNNQIWHQDSQGIKDIAEEGDAFGSALAVGDFNKDGFDDLAIGVPGEDLGEAVDAGLVHVIYGSANRLVRQSNQIWSQGSGNLIDLAEAGDEFGAALAAADFNGDGFCDLAIGVPGQAVSALADAGAIHVLKGSAQRLISAGNRVWHQDSNGILDEAGEGERFGGILRTGDFNNDGRFDLAIGIPSQVVDGLENAGAVHVMYSTKNGLVAKNNQVWHLNAAGMPVAAAEGDRFGWSLAAGDFNKDGFVDLAIGAPFMTVDGHIETGAVIVLRGSAARLTTTAAQFWHQDTTNVPGDNFQWDNFGGALSAGDFNKDGRCDLAVAIPGEDYNGINDAGAVVVLYSRPVGLHTQHAQYWVQDLPGMGDAGEANEYFGSTLGP